MNQCLIQKLREYVIRLLQLFSRYLGAAASSYSLIEISLAWSSHMFITNIVATIIKKNKKK